MRGLSVGAFQRAYLGRGRAVELARPRTFCHAGCVRIREHGDRDAAAHPAPLIAVGAICGLAWAAGFRGYMVELAGSASSFDWTGTFATLLLPGAIVGALLGWAEALRRTGGRRGWRWLALAPLIFAIAPLLLPGALGALFTEGLGGGAVAVALVAMGGGYAVSRRGPLVTRIVVGALSALTVAALALASPAIAGDALALTTPRGAWVAVLATTFVVVLALASSIPHRPVLTHTRPDARLPL